MNERLKRAGLLALLIVSNNKLSADANLLKSVFSPKNQPQKSETAPKTPTTERFFITERFKPGLVEQDFLQSRGIPIQPFLRFPDGIHQRVDTITNNHPVLRKVVTNNIKRLLSEADSPEEPERLGSFLKNLYLQIESQLDFPENYPEGDKTKIVLKLTFLAAASLSDQYRTVADAQTDLGIQTPATLGANKSQSLSLFYLRKLPKIFTASDAFFLNDFDKTMRGGPDGAQHLFSHEVTDDSFYDFLETGDPKYVRTNVLLGQWVINLISWLPLPNAEKVIIFNRIVGKTWEINETGDWAFRDLKDLAPLEILTNTVRALSIITRAMARNSFTGIFDMLEPRDEMANEKGATLAAGARKVTSRQAAMLLFQLLDDDPLINGDIPIYRDNHPRARIFELQKGLLALANLTHEFTNIPPLNNQSILEKAGQLWVVTK